MDVTLTSWAPEPAGMTAAAVSIVTGEDIRRSGVTTIPDALALATGVHVARFNNGSWSITSRGFNATTANKLLVMVDGRTVYSPLFSGVFWNTVDYTLEDVDHCGKCFNKCEFESCIEGECMVILPYGAPMPEPLWI